MVLGSNEQSLPQELQRLSCQCFEKDNAFVKKMEKGVWLSGTGSCSMFNTL